MNNKSSFSKSNRTNKVNVGPLSVAATGLGIFAILGLLALVLLGGGLITMVILAILHAQVSAGIPALGYWASFWLTIGLAWFGSFFRDSSN